MCKTTGVDVSKSETNHPDWTVRFKDEDYIFEHVTAIKQFK